VSVAPVAFPLAVEPDAGLLARIGLGIETHDLRVGEHLGHEVEIRGDELPENEPLGLEDHVALTRASTAPAGSRMTQNRFEPIERGPWTSSPPSSTARRAHCSTSST
jgi:hypothetical protein